MLDCNNGNPKKQTQVTGGIQCGDDTAASKKSSGPKKGLPDIESEKARRVWDIVQKKDV